MKINKTLGSTWKQLLNVPMSIIELSESLCIASASKYFENVLKSSFSRMNVYHVPKEQQPEVRSSTTIMVGFADSSG